MINLGRKYLYYTNNYKTGKLYEHSERLEELDFSQNEFDYKKIKKIKRKEDNKLINPFKDFKNYIKLSDFLCLALLILISIYVFIESNDERKCSYFKIANTILEVLLLMLYLIRFIKFIKIKKFLFENKDIYSDDDEYLPHKIFNIDSFPIAVIINIHLYHIIYFLFPNKISAYKRKDCVCEEQCLEKYACEIEKIPLLIFLISLPFIISYIIFPILDYINDIKIKKIYKNLKYNWNTSPIKSNELSDKNDYEFANIKSNKSEYRFYEWISNYFKINRIKDGINK